MTTHKLKFPEFDPTWSWGVAVVFLTTETHLLLIKRSLTMPTHAGQMALIGGHRRSDETHPFAVAAREFSEETGLPAEDLEFQGIMNPVMTSSLFPLLPAVAKLKRPLDEFLKKAVSNGEWTDLIAVPWDYLKDQKNWEWGRFATLDRDYQVLFIPISSANYQHQLGQTSETFLLWGATARMVWDYLNLYDAAL